MPISEETLQFMWGQRRRLETAGGIIRRYAARNPELAEVVAKAEAVLVELKSSADAEPRTVEGVLYMITALTTVVTGSYEVAVVHGPGGWPVAALSFGHRPGWLVVGHMGSARVLPGAGTALEVELARIAASDEAGVVTDDIMTTNERGDMDSVDGAAVQALDRLADRRWTGCGQH